MCLFELANCLVGYLDTGNTNLLTVGTVLYGLKKYGRAGYLNGLVTDISGSTVNIKECIGTGLSCNLNGSKLITLCYADSNSTCRRVGSVNTDVVAIVCLTGVATTVDLNGYNVIKIEGLLSSVGGPAVLSDEFLHSLAYGNGLSANSTANLKTASFTSALLGGMSESRYCGINVLILADRAGVSGITVLKTSGLGYNGSVVVLVSNNIVKLCILHLISSVICTKRTINSYFVTLNRLVVHCIVTSAIHIKAVDANLIAICILKVEVTILGVVKVSYNTGDVVLLSSVGVV